MAAEGGLHCLQSGSQSYLYRNFGAKKEPDGFVDNVDDSCDDNGDDDKDDADSPRLHLQSLRSPSLAWLPKTRPLVVRQGRHHT